MDTEEASWVVDEFGFADLGDERRTDRLIKLTTSLAQSPTASFPEVLKSQAELTGAYRFFENDQIDPEDILQSHTCASLERIRNVELVLAVQDTTELNSTSHKALEGAGPLTNEHCQGFFAHTTIAITSERVPLGVLSQLVWARDKEHKNKKAISAEHLRCVPCGNLPAASADSGILRFAHPLVLSSYVLRLTDFNALRTLNSALTSLLFLTF